MVKNVLLVRAIVYFRFLNGRLLIDTIRTKAKALDASIKSLCDNLDTINGFVYVRGKVHRINSKEEFEIIVKDSRPKLNFIISSISSYDDD